MTKGDITNMAHSVRQRLLNIARRDDEDYNDLLTRYALERLLYRLSISPYRSQFVLKGAMLFRVWADHPHRPTRDLDLLGPGQCSIPRLEDIFRDVCRAAVDADDGMVFLAETVHGEPIRADMKYRGVRVRLQCRLGSARTGIIVDVGYGDAVTPPPTEVCFPTLLDMSAPRLLAYPKETVIAEKFHAIVSLGMATSRMKDFFDLWFLAREHSFEGHVLARAITATFEANGTPLPSEAPVGLTEAFVSDRTKCIQWAAFLRKGHLVGAPAELGRVVEVIARFLVPVTTAVAAGEAFELTWRAPGPWAR